jgi:RimJ/RimL family protein N-acetyltransferase
VTVIARTPRLLLRPFEAADAPALHEVFTDPAGNRFTFRRHTTLDETEQWIAAVQRLHAELGYAPWAVVDRESRAVIGYCGCGRTQVGGRLECELGCRIVVPCWGRGLATEAARAACQHVEDALGLTRIIAIVRPDNGASLRVAERTGFRFEQEAVYQGVTVRILARHTGAEHD